VAAKIWLSAKCEQVESQAMCVSVTYWLCMTKVSCGECGVVIQSHKSTQQREIVQGQTRDVEFSHKFDGVAVKWMRHISL
jgi:hypothetical protein